jgi:anti-anti-sigma factor
MSTQAISVTVEHDHATIALRGEHEAYTADKLARQLSALIDEGLPVTVDLTETSFVDSTVIGVLLAARANAVDRGTDLELLLGHGTGWPVRRMLEITGLGAHLHVVD